MPVSGSTRRAAALAALALLPVTAWAQPTSPPPVWWEYAVGDDLERYLRSLQTLGAVPLHPWSLRGFSPVELDALQPAANAAHPWQARTARDTLAGGARVALLRPSARVRYNTAFPFGGNDGAVWAGRGATASATLGVAFRWGPLSATLAPTAFWSQNREFALTDNGRTGDMRFADGVYFDFVDRPQRFGDAAYARVDPGQSTVRLDAFGATIGASSANGWWGPAHEYPFLLGNNAAGFPHVFAGTSRPVNLWVARLHTRILWGRLDQSEYFEAPNAVVRDRRFATGILVVASPRGLEELEIGGARFFHAPWPDDGLPGRYLSRPFEAFFKTSLPETATPVPGDSRSIDGENQLAVVFARLALPRTGFELYTEIGREDHPWDWRHLILSPDEQTSVTVGFGKSWRRSGDRLATVRAEAINFQQSQIDRVRGGRATYIHGMGSNQGHTNRGQLLGADVGVGSSAGAMVALELYDPTGRSTLTWRRVVRQELLGTADDGTANRRALDVLHALSAERLLFRGAVDLSAGVDVVHNFNRNFAGDRTNVGLRFSAAGLPF